MNSEFVSSSSFVPVAPAKRFKQLHFGALTLPLTLIGTLVLSACEDKSTTASSNPDLLQESAVATPVEMEAADSAAQKPESFSPRLDEPRIQPVSGVDDPSLNAEQKAMLADRPDYNLYKTLVHHTELYNRWTPLGRVILNNSTLAPRHREIIMLRMGWLCQSEYEWAQHARIATAENIGMTEAEVHRIAADPDASEWTPFERTLMDMVDELRYQAMISDTTWNALRAEYSLQETMDAMFTAAQYQLVSMVLNSTGIQLDPELKYRLPVDAPTPALATQPNSPRLNEPRVPPAKLDDLDERQKEIIAPQLREDGSVYNLYATMIHHPDLYGPRYTFGSYLMRDSSLPAQTRELIIMRTGYLLRAEYEWAHHAPIALEAGLSEADIARIAEGPGAEGWNEEQAAVLAAVDELRREAFITDETWQTLSKYYNNKQLLELVFTVGGYTMTGLAINSLGIQVEPGFPAMPN